jgi:hypothetical protein
VTVLALVPDPTDYHCPTCWAIPREPCTFRRRQSGQTHRARERRVLAALRQERAR